MWRGLVSFNLAPAFFALLSAGPIAAQSPWVQTKAGFYAQAAWHFIPAYKTLFGPDGADKPLDRRLSEGTFQLYGEYGVTEKTTVIATLPLRFMKAGEFLQNFATPETAAGSLAGFGNISLGIRHQLINKRIPLSASLRVDLPTGRYDDATGLRTGYHALTVLPMLSTGIGLGWGYGFVYGGYGYRSNDYSHFLDFGVEAGLKIGKAWLIGFSEWVHPLKNGDIQLPLHNRLTGLYVNDQSYWSIGLKGSYSLTRFVGIVVSAAGAAQAENVPKSPGLGVAVYFKWE